jgi:hypothetical protein
MRAPTTTKAIVGTVIPLVAGIVLFAWGLIATLGGVPGCSGAAYEDAVDSWAFVGASTALLYCVFGAAVLAARLAGWLALLATTLMLPAVALGAQAGYAVGMAVAACEWDEGPAPTLSLFATAGALVGYACGWVLHEAGSRRA